MQKIAAIVLSVCLLSASFAFFEGPDPEAYMNPDKEEYRNLTSKIIGTYKIISLKDKDGNELMGDRFKGGKAVFKFEDENSSGVFYLELSDKVVEQNLSIWKEKYGFPELKVTSYKMVSDFRWKMDWTNYNDMGVERRVYLTSYEPNYGIVAGGEGANMDEFRSKEEAKYAATKSLIKGTKGAVADAGQNMFGGGFGGMLGGALMGGMAGNMMEDQLKQQWGTWDYIYVFEFEAGSKPRFTDKGFKWLDFEFERIEN
ncbi:MAG: hypothetical protein A2Y40_03100 [Candidatus Margulisbacteria bacterium GWF2_35_9]|nr:MAG: hypothetical protein A2Y40_03100 [Candidatus Margulisbacteria bacterium GWF2_35_9]